MSLHPPKFFEFEAEPGDALDAMRKLDRDARLPAFIDASRDVGAVFGGLDLAFVGAGSVGLPLIWHGARLAPRSLVIVDRAKLKPTSVLTHPIHPRDLGRSKAVVAAEWAKAISPKTRVFVFDGDLADLAISALAGVSHVFLASDNVGAEVLLSQRALRHGTPIVQAAVYGRTLSAVVRCVDGGDDGQGPSLCCGLSKPEWEALDRGEIYPCAPEDRATGNGALPAAVPTNSVSHLCSMAADLAFNAFFAGVAGLGKPGDNRLIEYCGYTNEVLVSKLERRRDCPLEHARDRVVARPGNLGDRTPRELFYDAGYAEDDRVSLAVEGRSFAGFGFCDCDVHPPLGRFLAPGAGAGQCSRCGSERSSHPMYLYKEVPASVLINRMDRSLASLGAADATAVRVRGERGAVQFVEEFPGAGGAR